MRTGRAVPQTRRDHLLTASRARWICLEPVVSPNCLAHCRSYTQKRLLIRKIHLGSGNIQMEPNSQYLCIVQDRKNSNEDVFLPFEGDNTLAVILSKAFMLADDRNIKDSSILSQIRVRR